MTYQERDAAVRDTGFLARVSQALAQHAVFLIYLTEGSVYEDPTYPAQVAFARQVLEGLNSHAQRIAVWVLAHSSQANLNNTGDLDDPQLLNAIQTVWIEYGQITAPEPAEEPEA